MSTDTALISINPGQVRSVGPLWRGAIAFVVDGLILYAVGRIGGAICFNSLSLLGLWGHLLGFILALVYFATLDSDVGGGQTIGKRLLQLRLVNALGNTIGWERSAVRFVIFAIPYFLTGPQDLAKISIWLIPFLIIFITLGIGGSTLYLVIFNRRTRQGLHDIAAGTYVVDAVASGPLTTEPIWAAHLGVIGSYLLLIAFTALSKGLDIEWQHKTGYVSQRSKDEHLIESLGGVQTAETQFWVPIQSERSAFSSFLPKKKDGRITVEWNGRLPDREAFANQVAAIILQNDPRAQNQDVIQIKVGRRYDLGIASGNNYQSFTHTPEEWHKRVFGIVPDAPSSPEPPK